MPFTKEHMRIVIGGDLRAGTADVDRWQFGFRVPLNGTLGGYDDGVMNTLLTDLAADVSTWWTFSAFMFGTEIGCDFVSANVIGKDGNYLSKTRSYRRDFTRKPGTAAESLPGDVSLAVTLNTAARRGRASKGRVFLPPPAKTALSGGRVTPTVRDAAGQGIAQLVKNIGNAPGLDATLGWSTVAIMSELGEGTTNAVTSVRVGDLFDTQRRRTNNMREVYTTYPIP